MKKQLNIEVKDIEDLELETLNAIFSGQREKVKELYKKADEIFQKGSDYTRSIVANKFISPLSQLLEMNYSWGHEYLILFPKELKAEHNRQVYSSGI